LKLGQIRILANHSQKAAPMMAGASYTSSLKKKVWS